MISFIIPTLFKVSRIHQTLQELSQCDEVGEIILIDNTTNPSRFQLSNLRNLAKIKYICEPENTYVNPAWNKGAQLAKFDKMCFLSDDVWFNWNHLKEISKYITEDNGMIGMSNNNFKTEVESLNMIPIQPDYINRNRQDSFACCFFMHKKSYIEIPNDMKIWAGDDWLFYKSKNNYIVDGIKCDGFVSATSDNLELKPKFDPVKHNDMMVMKRLISEGKMPNYLIGTYWENKN